MTPTAARGAAWTLRCDGGSRGNPGPGAYGFVLCDPAGVEIEARGEYLGVCTNNVAEYRSLIAGLAAAAEHGVRDLVVRMDSQLVVRQMLGQYRVKHESMKPLFAEARAAGRRSAASATNPCRGTTTVTRTGWSTRRSIGRSGDLRVPQVIARCAPTLPLTRRPRPHREESPNSTGQDAG